jgi:xanthine dehydrogenase accessory factor
MARRLVTLHGPAWRLLIIGAGQISRYLATMAQALGYRVYICDPRSEYADGWDVPGTERIAAMPDDAVTELGLDPRSAVVALTHDPKLDDLALLEALKSPAFYVGALGSQANNSKRRERCCNISTSRRLKSTACTARSACPSAAGRRRKLPSPSWPK